MWLICHLIRIKVILTIFNHINHGQWVTIYMQRPSQVIMGQPAYLPPIVQPIQSFIFRRPGSQPCKWIMHKCSSIVWCITRGRENQPGWRRIGYSQCKLTVTRHRWSLGVADEVMESYATATWKAASASMQGCDGTMGERATS